LDGDPVFTAKLALTASESLFFIAVLDISVAYFLGILLSKLWMIIITLVILVLNMFVFLSKNKVQEIIQAKPKFFQRDTLSVILTWIFFLTTTSTLFWVGDVVNYIIDNCKR
jgi:hypothetical protein